MSAKRLRCFQLNVVLPSLLLMVSAHPGTAQRNGTAVGVNVNNFQNMDAAQQQEIVSQLKQAGVTGVRTSLRPDEKNLALAKSLQSKGIGLVLDTNILFASDAQTRPADAKRHLRSAMPLSAADPEKSRAYYQTLFDKLDQAGIVLTGIEAGNELNWTDFNGDFPIPGEGKAFDLQDLSHDPEAEQVAKGYLQYLKVLAALKEVRDHSRLNRHTPIIAAGMASIGAAWEKQLGVDSVSIPATYTFLRNHGLDNLVDGYGVHATPPEVRQGDAAAVAQRAAMLDKNVFPPGNGKPYWITEWGFTSDAQISAQDQARTHSVVEVRAYLQHLAKQGRLAGMFWYVWNEPDHASIYRGGSLLEAGHLAIQPLASR